MSDLRFYAKSPNWEISNPVLSPVPLAGVASPVAIAPGPTTRDMDLITNSPKKWPVRRVTQNLPSPAAIRKAESEIAEYRKFQGLTDDLVDVNRKICRLRPVEQTEQTAQEKKRRKRSSKKSSVK